ncbi:MAG: transglutaminase family protein [Planctomycetes bacterium]|nr:transglutaminase family protein [Planctomycetota bacterium]
MHLRVRHRTRYAYDRAVALGPHVVRLRPAPHTRAEVTSYDLRVGPDACRVRWQRDPWANRVARVTFPVGATSRELALDVELTLEVRPVNPFDFFLDDRCRTLPWAYPDGLADELRPFLGAPERGPRLREWLARQPAAGDTIEFLVELNARVARDVRYVIRQEAGIQTSEETLTLGRGSCRDSAVLLVDLLRAHGLAARFVSGYLVQLADEGNIPDLPRGLTRDAVDLHAWAEVYMPGGGWIGLDGTSGLFCGEGHVPLCVAVQPELAAPVTGSASAAASAVTFELEVTRLGHEPRPRRPYTDEQWEALRAAGRAVDARLRAEDLRLTMGGEPTWTSREHPRAPEWNAEALGPTKWSQGLRLAHHLRERLPAGALVLEQQGKHYPGESLPRWALRFLWRADGAPVWRDPARLDLRPPGDAAPDEPARSPEELRRRQARRAGQRGALERARALGAALAERLGLPAALVMPGFEDPWVFATLEENLPVDLDPLALAGDASEDRRRLTRVLDRGLDAPAGFALPLAHDGTGWTSAEWTFRRGHLFLTPGDAPMGLRLPLDRISGRPADPLLAWPEDPFARPPALGGAGAAAPAAFRFDPRQAARPAAARVRHQGPRHAEPPAPAGEWGPLRTALCVEPRAGVVHVFLPPLAQAERFLELVAAVEDAAGGVGVAVRLEGYGPPADPRLLTCSVTPDPGVLEVNLPPSEGFDEYVGWLERAADAANRAGLTSERYQLDGRETGSGGGHHLTLGGPTPPESPFLRRPDLLASLLRYLQHHPALSYAFTGLFVGPTSQAPRVDEARMDALDELELALSRLPAGGDPPPWLIDRLLRNLLTDVSGNTHRTEVSIDKLFDPAGPAGRQGLIELRAFEMPPHERMAAAQMLLARGLVARFAREPYTRPLLRWGRRLHDEFMLPHFLWRDLEDVLDDLRAAGLPFDDAWYRAFLDIRFPVLGRLETDGLVVELRQALEPWPVLGEEASGGGVSRYVDSSLERVQVRVEGMVDERHVVCVNGHALPLHPTGRAGEYVAGVRFRAWQPPHCLQPTIGIHHPLRFDVVDVWAARSLGACSWHVWHPEGRSFDEPPLTAFEAASRRAQRFTRDGHAQWPVLPRPARARDETPRTLDLRWLEGDRPAQRREVAW